MTYKDHSTETNSWRQRLWPTGLAFLLVISYVPKQSEFIRTLWIGTAIALLVSAWWKWRRTAWLRTIPITILVLTTWASLAPGDSFNESRLRESYRQRLQSFATTPYVKEGSTRMGLDETGLLTRAMMAALGRETLAGRNAAALRARWLLWWQAPTLAELRDQDHQLTSAIGQAGDLVAAHHLPIAVGDMAITWSGDHAWVYVGEYQWLGHSEATGGKIIIDTSHHEALIASALKPVKILRWRWFSGPTNLPGPTARAPTP